MNKCDNLLGVDVVDDLGWDGVVIAVLDEVDELLAAGDHLPLGPALLGLHPEDTVVVVAVPHHHLLGLEDLLLEQLGPGEADQLTQPGPGPGELEVDVDVDVPVELRRAVGLPPVPHAGLEDLPVGARGAVPDAEGVGGGVLPVGPVGVEGLHLLPLEVGARVVVGDPQHHVELLLHLQVGPAGGQPLEARGPAPPGVGGDYQVALHPPLADLVLLHLQLLNLGLDLLFVLLQLVDLLDHLIVLLHHLPAHLLHLGVLLPQLCDSLLVVE